MPKSGSIYSVNEGNFVNWEGNIKKWVLNNKNPTGSSSKKKKLRYVGALVADAHRTLINGGIFAYPPDKSNSNGNINSRNARNKYKKCHRLKESSQC